MRHVPVLGTRALAQLGLSGNLATRVDWGGHAIWHLWPSWRVSVDGRNLTVYPESFVERQLTAYDRGEPLAGLAGHRDSTPCCSRAAAPASRGWRGIPDGD